MQVKGDPSLLTPIPTPEPGSLGDHKAEPGKKPGFDLSASELISLTDSPTPKPVIERDAKNPAVLTKAELNAIGTYLVHNHKLIQQAIQAQESQIKDIATREKQIEEEKADLKKREQELAEGKKQLGDGIGGILKEVDQAHKLENLKPGLVILHLLKYNLPELEEALQKVKTLKTQEAKNEFVRLCSTIVGSELRNTLALNKDATLEGLKASLTKEKLASIFSEQASNELLGYIAMAVDSAKTQSVAPKTTKEIWMARFFETANKLYPLIPLAGALSVAQAVGQGVHYIMPDSVADFASSITPDLVNNFVALVQEYVTYIGGSHIVPIALFAIGAILYYLAQLAYMAKEKVRPTDEATKAKIEEAAMRSKFAQNAVTV